MVASESASLTGENSPPEESRSEAESSVHSPGSVARERWGCERSYFNS